MLFNYGYGQQQNQRQQKSTSNAGDLNHHANVAVQCEAHRPMEHIPGFARSHWMPPSCECLRRIAPAAVMVDKLFKSTKHQQKTIFG